MSKPNDNYDRHATAIQQMEERIEKNREKAEKYDGEKGAWFRGIATGYEGALEVLREDE